ncbi:MAG: hypothetical protein HYW49_11100 [Deltaproteobacteria bacterium]|nr:hypothetical protein [Deltaproteobacteria bacterium]
MIEKIRLVTLDNAYCAATQPLAKTMFGELLCLRAEGYGSEYPPSFLPLDAADYVVWHHLFCVEEATRLIPVAGFRQVSLKRCDFYQIKMPLLKTAEDANAHRHLLALNAIFSESRQEDMDAVYSAGLTIKKHYRGIRELSAFVRELGAALTYADMLERAVHSYVCAAVLRFKTNIWFQDVGYRPLELNGETLSIIHKVSAGNEPMLLMHLTEISDWAKSCREKHEFLFRKRLVIEPKDAESAGIEEPVAA